MSTAKELSIIEKVKNDPTVIDVLNRVNEVIAIRQEIFQKGVHFGPPYKGAKNDTLLKPGATFLQQKYQLHELHERLETTIHVDPTDLSKSYIIIQDRCRIFDSHGQELAQADAACTTFEDKYLYRGGGDRTCPQCGNPNIMRSAYPPKNNPNAEKGWYCNNKKGGCGASFDYNTPAITDQQVAKSLNENPLNLLDTIVAMAQKRASVRSTIKATGVDALFSPGDGVTVDFYDDVFDGDDLTKAGNELIQVVQKHDAVISHVEPPSSDAAQINDKTDVDPTNAAMAAKSALAGNGAPTNGKKKSITDDWPKSGFSMGEFKTHVFKTFYNKNTFHMNGSLQKLFDAGKLPPTLTLEQAYEVVKNRKDEAPPAVVTDENRNARDAETLESLEF